MIQGSSLQEGIEFYEKGEYKKALDVFLLVPEEVALNNMETAYYIGLCYTQLSQYEDAMLYLEQVVTSEDTNERILQCRFLLAVIYCISGRKRLADFELDKLLKAGYKVASVYASMAYIAFEGGEVERSLELYENALRLDSNNSTALNGIGYVLACQKKDLMRALTCCKKALSQNPLSAACLDSLGYVYLKMGLTKDALNYLGQALEKDSANKEIAQHLREAKTGEI